MKKLAPLELEEGADEEIGTFGSGGGFLEPTQDTGV